MAKSDSTGMGFRARRLHRPDQNPASARRWLAGEHGRGPFWRIRATHGLRRVRAVVHMCYPYDRKLLDLARRIALEEKIVLHRGVFVAVAGPNLETRAEYRFLRFIGGDVVGMSTVPEIIVGVHSGMRNVGISVITDMGLPDALEPVNIADIIATANAAEKKLRVLVRRLVQEC